MAAPTEPPTRLAVEVLELWEARRKKWPRDDEMLREAIDEHFDLIDYHPPTDANDSAVGDAVWTNLRPSEITGLQTIVTEAKGRAFRRCIDVLREEVLAAAVRFDEDFPDTPRQPDPERALA